MSNEQDNKPERTAMQQMIDWLEKRPLTTSPGCLEKAIELRDTVEKEQIESAYSRGAEDENLHITRNFTEPSAFRYYNEKYGTDGK